MAILRLNPLRKGAMLPPQEPALWKKLGRQIKRRMADAWPRFADTILLYRQMLVDAGHDARGAEQFSALLACADLMLHDEVPDRDTLDEWGKVFEADRWRESVEQSSNAQKCLDWLAQSQPEIYRGGSKQTVAEAVRALIKMREQDAATDQDKKPYRELLAAGGLSLVFRREDRTMVLAVSVAHRQTVKLFEGTIWSVGAGASGGWVEALTRLEGVERNKRSKIAGRTEACVHVPIHLVLAEDPPEPEPAT